MHALTLACLKYVKEITMTASTQSFSQCRTGMIRNLLSEKASQSLNSIMLKFVVCMDKLKLLILSHVRLLHLCDLFMDCYSSILLYLFIFEVYIQHVFELWTLNPPVLNLPKNWCTPTQLHHLEVPIEHSQLVSPIFGLWRTPQYGAILNPLVLNMPRKLV